MQPLHRLRLRGRLALERRSAWVSSLIGRGVCPIYDHWPVDFESCDSQARSLWPSSAEVASQVFPVLGYRIDLSSNGQLNRSIPRLVNFHVHYWDWAWALSDLPSAEAQVAFAKLFDSWVGHSLFPQGDAWSPYVVSLRSWSWCCQFNSMVKGGPAENAVRQMLWKQLSFVRSHLEKDVGGNHLIKNLKAWVALGLFFDSRNDVHSATEALSRELNTQVLSDGGHYEMAPAYHVQVLADLIDIRNLLSANRLLDLIPQLGDVVHSMQHFLGAVTGPDDRVVLLNDGFPVNDDMLRIVQPQGWSGASAIFPYSGLARLQSEPWTVFMDVGDPCPDQLPAHAHADTLGCLVFFERRRLIGEAFTSTYGNEDRRVYERSTAAHSTVEIANQNSTEVWGAFRAGRRARVRNVHFLDLGPAGSSVSASHDGYRSLPGSPVHTREIVVCDAGVIVTDSITGARVTPFSVRWHVPANPTKCDEGSAWILDSRFELRIESEYPTRVESSSQALGFELLAESAAIIVQGAGQGTIVIRTHITQHSEAK